MDSFETPIDEAYFKTEWSDKNLHMLEENIETPHRTIQLGFERAPFFLGGESANYNTVQHLEKLVTSRYFENSLWIIVCKFES